MALCIEASRVHAALAIGSLKIGTTGFQPVDDKLEACRTTALPSEAESGAFLVSSQQRSALASVACCDNESKENIKRYDPEID
jgi:hypothetical protein